MVLVVCMSVCYNLFGVCTLQERQTDLTFAGISQVSDLGFTMVVHEKIFLVAYTKTNTFYSKFHCANIFYIRKG